MTVFCILCRIEEYWDPVLMGLDPIIVTRQVPAIHIFLTLDNVDPKTLGYQEASTQTPFWPEPSSKQQKKDEDYAYKHKRSFNGNSRNNNQQRPKGKPQSSEQSTSGQSSSSQSIRNRKPRNEQKTSERSTTKPQEAAASSTSS